MKIVSEEHFERMQMMCRVFGDNSIVNKKYLPEYEASKSVNVLIRLTENPDTSDFDKIIQILKEVDNTPHINGSQWLDYKIHVMATLRENGCKDTSFV